MRIILPFLFALAGCGAFETGPNSFLSATEPKHGFLGEVSDFPSEDYNSVWNILVETYGNGLPTSIEIVKHDFGDGTSRFRADTNPMSVWINPRTYQAGVALSVIAHESAHLAHWRMTYRGENEYAASYFNEFRFIDEGFANVIGDRAAGREQVYRRRVGAAVFQARNANHIVLREVENWHSAPSSPNQPGRFDQNLPSYFDYDYSYEVGSSFAYYLDSTVPTSRVIEMIEDFGQTLDLGHSLANVYGDVLTSEPQQAKTLAEAGWKDYVDQIAFEPQQPRVDERFPADGTRDASCETLSEIYATFDQPMNTNIIALDTTTASQYGISFQNATWVSDRKLKVSVEKEKLVPGVLIELRLGYDGPQGYYPLKSDLGSPLPITAWSFSCISEP